MKSDALLLKSIIEYCDAISDDISTYGNDEEIFKTETRFQRSCSFSLFQIGENVKKLSASVKEENPQIDWSGISGLRDIIGHAYGGIDLSRIWLTISEEAPVLRKECSLILKKME